MSPALESIERRRTELGVTRAELERRAELSPAYYSKLLRGEHRPRETLIARLNAALNNIARKRGRGAEFPLAMAYRLALIVAAHALGQDPAAAQAADPAQRATQSQGWMRAAEARRLALYLLTSECGFSQSDVARAAGMTRSAVHEACKDLETIRDEGSAFEAMVDRLRDWIMGDQE